MIDYGAAFSYPFRDRDWLLKFVIGGAFILLSFLLVGLPVVYGYCIEVQQRVRRGEDHPLPEWKDVGVRFIVGFKFLVTLFVYRIPLFIVAIPFMILVILASGARELGAAEVVGGITFVAFIAFVMLYGVLLLLLMPLIAHKYSEHEHIREGLQIVTILSLVGEHWRELLLIAAMSIAIGVLALCGLVFFLVGVLLTLFYAMLVQFHLYGQLGRQISETPVVNV
ncbi:MAG TPA: DUF4013 domain-containing protein [Bacteroidota bacterium]|nr:DUF4013 domain-containing protein [Bacteroidota bacterium]